MKERDEQIEFMKAKRLHPEETGDNSDTMEEFR